MQVGKFRSAPPLTDRRQTARPESAGARALEVSPSPETRGRRDELPKSTRGTVLRGTPSLSSKPCRQRQNPLFAPVNRLNKGSAGPVHIRYQTLFPLSINTPQEEHTHVRDTSTTPTQALIMLRSTQGGWAVHNGARWGPGRARRAWVVCDL